MKTHLFALLIATSLTAALPPFAQSSREIQAILADPKLYELLGSAEGIEEIIRVEDGYDVFTRSKSVHAHIRYVGSKMMGPVNFEVELSPYESGEYGAETAGEDLDRDRRED
jgi:hypothetical protein